MDTLKVCIEYIEKCNHFYNLSVSSMSAVSHRKSVIGYRRKYGSYKCIYTRILSK